MEKTKNQSGFWQDMARPVVVLVIICLVASALLGAVNAKTKPVIEANKNAAAVQTRQEVLPAATAFEELPVSEELAARGVTGIFKGDNNSGYVVTASNKGYGGDVVVTVGFDPSGAILKVKADVSTETTGVGSKVGEDAVLNGFIGVTDNADNVKLRSGATYTSNAVRNSVNAAFDAVASVR